MPTAEILSILALSGWSVEAEKPLTIRHDETGDVATGQAAILVGEQLLADMRAEGSCVPEEATTSQAFNELAALSLQVDQYVDTARADEGSQAWAVASALVFGKDIAERVTTLLARLGQTLDYSEQEASARDDVCAYQAALGTQVSQLRPFFASAEANRTFGEPGFEVRSSCGRVWFLPAAQVLSMYVEFVMQTEGLDFAAAKLKADRHADIQLWFAEQTDWADIVRLGRLVSMASTEKVSNILDFYRDNFGGSHTENFVFHGSSGRPPGA